IDDHYKAESQTLTSDAEANILKLAELRNTLTPPQADRWTQIKTAYQRSRTLAGNTEDPSVSALLHLADKLAAIEKALRAR
ncbi:ATP-binding protein, partial [Micromonospora aurantiaca]|nr:ATP-binding protein [Micromonospora aurantiaca]